MRLTQKTMRYFLAAALLLSVMLAAFAASATSDKWTDSGNVVTSWYNPNYVTFNIDSAGKLAGVAKLVNDGTESFSGKVLKVTGDLDLSAHKWEPIGTEAHPFRGTLTSSGGTVRLSGLTVDGSYKHAGLIGSMTGATVGGFQVSGSIAIDSAGQVWAGAIVGQMDNGSIVYDVTNEASVSVETTSEAWVGGIAGNAAGQMSNVINAGAVTLNKAAKSRAGGVTAAVYGQQGLLLKKVKNEGAVTVVTDSVYSYAGGIVGIADASLAMAEENTPIRNSGPIKIESGANHSSIYAGGIVGRATQSVTFSSNTVNEGSLTVEAATADMSAVGGLAGSLEHSADLDISFVQSGNIVHKGGANVHTGGVVGLVNGSFIWKQTAANKSPITASGVSSVFTGGLIGKAAGTVTFAGKAQNEAELTVSATGSGIYTGGLVGEAGAPLSLNAASASAYVNSGHITVNGSASSVYTGGIIARQGYVKAADNVQSKGNMVVSGTAKLYTGGYTGEISGSGVPLAAEAFGGSITVHAADSSANSEVYTGGIVGRYDSAGSIASPAFHGHIAVKGGAGAYTGGVAGYFKGASITGANVGNSADSFAGITSDGSVGGVAGYAEGNVSGASVRYTELQTEGAGQAYAGLVAGRAKGLLSGLSVGDADFVSNASVKLTVKTAQTAAGGIVGADAGPLALEGSRVSRVLLTATADATEAKVGGLAGSLSPSATVGSAQGAAAVADADLTLAGARTQAGGLIGANATALSMDTVAPIHRVRITAQGDEASLGGAVGFNSGLLSGLTADAISIDAAGANSRLGGLVGITEANLVQPKVYASGEQEVTRLSAGGAGSVVGGVAGLARHAAVSGDGTAANAQGVVIETQAAANEVKAGGLIGESDQADMTGVVVKNPVMQAQGAQNAVGGIAGLVRQANIAQFKLIGELPDYAVISASGAESALGGVAGRVVSASVTGDAATYRVQNAALLVAPGATNAYAGGLVGFGEESGVKGVFAQNVKLTLKESGAAAGGIAGYNKGTNEAVIADNYLEAVSLTAEDTAASSTIGGLIGLNAERAAGADAAAIESAVSTVQNSRMVGGISSQAASAVIGGLIGENRSFVANNSIADKIPVLSQGDHAWIGGLIGKNTGTIYYTYSNAILTVSGKEAAAGGLVGENTASGRVVASYTQTDLQSEAYGSSGGYALLGGLAAANSGSVANSFTSAEVTGRGAYTYAGGLIGQHLAGAISSSYAAKPVTVSGEHGYAGGLIGYESEGTVRSSYSAGQVNGTAGASAGGFVGYYDHASKQLIVNSYYVKDEGQSINSGLLDFGGGTYYELNLYERLSPILAETLADRTAFPALSGWMFSETMWRYGSLNAAYKYPELNLSANTGGNGGGGSGSGGSTVSADIAWYIKEPSAIRFTIKNEADLAGLAGLVNGTITGQQRVSFKGRIIEITAPIHFQSTQWTPIGDTEEHAFEGTLIGNHHLISGLRVSSGGGYAGLFGVIGQSASLSQIVLEPLSVTGAQHVGALAGWNKGTVSSVRVTLAEGAQIGNGVLVGGIFGQNSGAFSDAALDAQPGSRIASGAADAIIGGLAGDNGRDIGAGTATFAAGTVAASGERATVGGLIGRQAGNADMLSIFLKDGGAVTASGADSTVGGLVGRYMSGTADGLEASLTDGALRASGTGSVIGGAIGKSEAGQIVRHAGLSANEGAASPHILASGTVGGLIGEKSGNGTNQFEADGLTVKGVRLSVQGDDSVLGGVVGKLTGTAVANSKFAGTIDVSASGAAAGGIAGSSDNSILYKTEVASSVMTTNAQSGTVFLGGVAGWVAASNPDTPFDFGLLTPLYAGIYEASVSDTQIVAQGSGQAATVKAGGIAGELRGASLYHSRAEAGLQASGMLSATLGGIAGESSGFIVNSRAEPRIEASGSALYSIGGAVGQATGGKLAYVSALSGGSAKMIDVGGAVSKSGVDSAAHVGGFIGAADATSIVKSRSSVPVRVVCDNPHNTIYAGGFAGLLGESGAGTIEQAYAEGAVETSGRAGAYAGGFAGTINRYAVKEAYASGSVSNTAFDARGGGFAAVINKDGTVEDAYAAGAAVIVNGAHSATRSYAGGFAGYNNGSLTRVYESVSDVQAQANGANSYMGAFIGYNFQDGRTKDSWYTGSLKPIQYDRSGGQTVSKASFADKPLLENWSFTGGQALWSYAEGINHNEPVLAETVNWSFYPDFSFMSNQVQGNAVFSASSAEQLAAIVLLHNDAETYRLFDRAAAQKPSVGQIKLLADINLSGKQWTPIAAFAGTFDGGQHTVSGLTNWSGDENGAPYGFITDNTGTIRNVTFSDAYVTGGADTGVIASVNKVGGVISGVKVRNSTVKGLAARTGGIVGSNEGTVKEAAIETLSIAGIGEVGGIVGANSGELSGAAASGDVSVTGTGDLVGGIVGETSGPVSVMASGRIQAASPEGRYVAAIAGRTTGAGAAIAVNGDAKLQAVGREHVGGAAGYASGPITRFEADEVTVTAAEHYAGGAAGEALQAISGVKLRGLDVTGKQYVGGLAGSAGPIAGADLGSIRITGESRIGGIAGSAAGDAQQIAISGAATVTGSGDYVGGVAGISTGGIGVSKLSELTVSSPSGTYVGGIVGQTSGAVITVLEAGGITVTGGDYTGGLAGESSSAIQTATLSRVSVKGGDYVGGAAGRSSGRVEQIVIPAADVSGHNQVGGINGFNQGAIANASVKGSVQGDGGMIGGIAGVNAGSISHSFAKVDLKASNDSLDVAAGGIAGRNAAGAAIEQSYSYSSIAASAPSAHAGGIAGENEGAIQNSFHSGVVEASGSEYARAGGIAGYGAAGSSIKQTVSAGQAIASVNGKLLPGRTFTGGIAGQLAGGTELATNYFDAQMLQRHTAYADDSGASVKEAAGKAVGLKTAALAGGTLPGELDTRQWTAVNGSYPRLRQFETAPAAIVASAAVMLKNEADTAFRVTGSYTPTGDPALVWSTAAEGHTTILTASLNGESRSITINRSPVLYADTAAKPTSPTELQFESSINVVLSTTEAVGTIHYTLDGTEPDENSPVYAQPIPVTATTTIKAITVVENKNNSEPLLVTYTKVQPTVIKKGGGGGGGGIPSSSAAVIVNGQVQRTGAETKTQQNGKSFAQITVDQAVVTKALEQQAGPTEVEIAFQSGADTSTATLDGQLVKLMNERGDKLKVSTASGVYTIPAARIPVQAISGDIGASLANLQMQVEISEANDKSPALLETASAQEGFKAVSAPISFKLSYQYGGNTKAIGRYDGYAEMAVIIPDSLTAGDVTTAVILNEDGTVSHLPTRMEQADGRTYAVASTLTSDQTIALVSHASAFADVSEHWAKAIVNDMGSRLAVGGVGDGLFEPDRNVTRAEFAAIIAKSLGVTVHADKREGMFTDVRKADWYAPYIGAVYDYGLVRGYEDGSFGANAMLTREQAMTILARAMRLTEAAAEMTDSAADEVLTNVADKSLISEYARNGVAAALQSGLVTGRSEGMIAPDQPITRAEVAAIVQRMLKKSKLI